MFSVEFGICAIAIGLVAIIMRRTWGDLTARTFEKSSWVGLKRSSSEWAKSTVLIGGLWIAGGVALILIGLFAHR